MICLKMGKKGSWRWACPLGGVREMSNDVYTFEPMLFGHEGLIPVEEASRGESKGVGPRS